MRTARSSRAPMRLAIAIGAIAVVPIAVAARSDSDRGHDAADQARPAITASMHYGSADAAERWLTPVSTSRYGSPDAAEHWLSEPPVTALHGSPDATERWLVNGG